MQNEEAQNMNLYIPKKCSATNRLITSKDHASIQINIGHLDEDGVFTGQFSTFVLGGFVRAQADVDRRHLILFHLLGLISKKSH